MKVIPRSGIDQLLFGMKRPDVEKIYGTPNREFIDDDQNIIWLYNAQRFRLTFYEDEGFRLGYIIASNPELELSQEKVVGANIETLKEQLQKYFKAWESEVFDMTENHFNEENWFIFQSEFGVVTKIEMGVVAKTLDDFDWKFK
jgi:hypothetical protein